MSHPPITTTDCQATPYNWSDGIVAILSKSYRAVGTGFVVSEEGLIVTCAHVLADNVGVAPGDKVSLRFKGNGQIAEATVTAWWRDKTTEDVAFLSLLVKVPEDVVVLPLAIPDDSLGQTLVTFGYPKVGLFDGLWGEGTALQMVDESGFSRLQLRSQEITHGFSGAPLYDKIRNCVVGMVQQGARPDRAGRLRDTAFATPAETLVAVCSQIPLVKTPRPALDVVVEPLPPCPYRGLFAFREADKDLFFGREALTQRLANVVLRQRLVVVLGPSGSGKSSLVFAGLLPQLRPNPDWFATDFRPGSEPFKALAATLLPWLEPTLSETDQMVETNKLASALAKGDLPLVDVLQRIGQKEERAGYCLLVADQFEELFTLCQSTKRQAFLDMLLATLCEPGPLALTLVATLRADFMGQALAYRPLANALQDHAFIVGPMNAAELQTAIEQPALQQKISFERGLVARILEDVGDEPGNLPLLEFALTRLWDESQTSPLTHQAYEAIGQVQGALANHADHVYERLTPEQKEQMRRVFVQLVQPGTGTEDTRRQATRDELGEVGWHLAQHLAGPETRLLVTNQDEMDRETVEVIHEALIQRWKPLQAWMEQDREFRSWQERLRDLHKQWFNNSKNDDALLRGYQIGEAERWLGERNEHLSLDEQAFIKASQKHEETVKAERVKAEAQARAARRLRVLAIALVIMVIIAFGLSLVAVNARSKAEINEHLAQTRASEASSVQDEAVRLSQQIRALQLATQAELAFVDDPELALLLAVAAVNSYKSVQGHPLPEAERSLYMVLNSPFQGLLYQGTVYRHTDAVYSANFSPDGQRLVTGSWGGTVKLWDVRARAGLAVLTGHADVVYSASFSPDGQRVMTASFDGMARLWDAETGAELALLAGHTDGIISASFSPDGQYVVTASRDRTARLWDAETGAELVVLEGHTRAVLSASFNPDGTRVVTTSGDKTARLWDVETGVELAVLEGHTSWVNSASFNPDGSRVVTASSDGTVRLWDAGTGAELTVFEGHVIGVNSASFSPDGQQVVTASNDRTARLWDAESGAKLAIFTGHTDAVNSASFSPDGTRVVTASRDGTARLWDAETGVELTTFEGHTGLVYSASFSPDGYQVVTASLDNTARIWHVLPYSSVEVMMAEASRRLSRGFKEEECQLYFRDDLADCPREAP